MHGNSAGGIYLDQNIYVEYNTVYDNAGPGVLISTNSSTACDPDTLQNNTFYDNADPNSRAT